MDLSTALRLFAISGQRDEPTKRPPGIDVRLQRMIGCHQESEMKLDASLRIARDKGSTQVLPKKRAYCCFSYELMKRFALH